jgi:CRISPR-associated helicase Cas3
MRLLPRKAKVLDGGFHPFQKQTLDSLFNHNSIVLSEAPVGSGKSRIVREALNRITDRPIVLTYPTRILLQAQIASLQTEMKGLTVLPWNRPVSNVPMLFEYSGATLLRLARERKQFQDRSQLLLQLFSQITDVADHVRAVMTPDVLHLIVTMGFYKDSRHIQRHLMGGVFIFDEFHLYFDLGHFVSLVRNIMERLEGTVVLLSATPLMNAQLRALMEERQGTVIGFSGSSADPLEPGRVFNQLLNLNVREGFRLQDLRAEAELFEEILMTCEKPAAVIIDSVFRLRHLIELVRARLRSANLSIHEWSGEKKEEVSLGTNTVILGTSAIEVGIDLDFKTLVMEASTWASAVQRLGRAGRRSPGTVHLITRKRFMGLLDGKDEMDRSAFENEVLLNVFSYSDPDEEKLAASAAGEMFRGDSYSFALYDVDRSEAYFADEAMFARYAILDPGNEEWRVLSAADKRKELQRHMKLPSAWVEEILLRDRVFPFWGVLKGKLRDRWEKTVVRRHARDELLEIICDEPYHFYGK